MQILLKQAGKIPITEEMVEAAASNWKRGEAVMQLLLRQDADITIKEDAAMIMLCRLAVRLDVATGTVPQMLEGHTDRISAVAFSLERAARRSRRSVPVT
jgi:hypothetical protein